MDRDDLVGNFDRRRVSLPLARASFERPHGDGGQDERSDLARPVARPLTLKARAGGLRFELNEKSRVKRRRNSRPGGDL
jgi:hypothetical protein